MLNLSIAITTYNHEKYIAQALDSVYKQNLNCDFEIVIGNDCSTDKTLQIIQEYKNKYNNIKVLNYTENVGYTVNFDKTLKACSGKYIAIFDGDDIMLAGKIQKQISFLDENPDYVMCTHKVRAFNSEDNETIRYINPPHKKEYYTIEDIIKYGSIFANSSKIFRKSALSTEGIDYNIEKIADWYITIRIAQEGKIKYFDESLLDYRVHKDSIMKKIKGNIHHDDVIYILNKISEIYQHKYDHLYYHQYAYAYLIKGIYFINNKQNNKARYLFIRSILKSPFYSISAYIRLFLSFLPQSVSYNLLKNRS